MKLGIEGVLAATDAYKLHYISIIRGNSKLLGHVNSYMSIRFHSKTVS